MDDNEVLHSRENAVRFFLNYIAKDPKLISGKKIYDLSAGTGYIANKFYEAGALVKSYDLFPEQNNEVKRLLRFLVSLKGRQEMKTMLFIV
jgi:2-polyprenyl-3-methyl-5-hydroxy-6-metoxy-1,4-benzoquinol methylase